MLELTIKAKTLTELKDNLVKVWTELDGKNTTTEPVETTGSVEQDLAIAPTTTPSREDLKPKRTRRTKAELEAEKAKSDLADGPANSRPVTINDSLMVTEGVVKEPVAEIPKQSTDSSGSDEAVKYANFKDNFTKIIFMMMQNKTIDSAYIEAKQKYYSVASILSIKDDDARLEHFYQALRTEGKV